MQSLPFQFISCFVATDTVGSNREVSQMGDPAVKPGAQHTTERERERETKLALLTICFPFIRGHQPLGDQRGESET